jgi:hypothetical protein
MMTLTNLRLWRNLFLLRLRQLRDVPAMARSYRAETARRQADPTDLRNFERQVFSQHAEDGSLAEIFRRIGPGERRFVEFGIEDGTECCTRRLLEEDGWSGVWIEGSAEHVARARERFAALPVRIDHAFIDAENIESLFARNGVPAEPDLLVIDIDGNDFWVWQAIRSYRPRAVVLEYNGAWGPATDWVMPYNPAHRWDFSTHYGASLAALARLGAEKGYALVGCDTHGINAYFVRRDLLGEHFPMADAGPAYHYVRPKALFFERWRRLLD